ncbi:hypothetical protein HBH98_078410 [Parastagonospora nodorum]|nr:hypothetical protein HBH51_246030 [Parastagonospora nodorum]KAH4001392.1 hypothetical protein HBI10_089900 [Parastagonospora nodorum]KAH4027421.1 hypothetical protein HBI13_058920 [Parastagonospora nodorum]KAH4348261.1 hypothetical protein HBH98_078410 [Parastagonospora nodorum]KAH4390148.1 hypothetical protein HBH97_048780 [Parastagonospora nodorum]
MPHSSKIAVHESKKLPAEMSKSALKKQRQREKIRAEIEAEQKLKRKTDGDTDMADDAPPIKKVRILTAAQTLRLAELKEEIEKAQTQIGEIKEAKVDKMAALARAQKDVDDVKAELVEARELRHALLREQLGLS